MKKRWIVLFADGTYSCWLREPKQENFQTGAHCYAVEERATVDDLIRWASRGFGEMECPCITIGNW